MIQIILAQSYHTDQKYSKVRRWLSAPDPSLDYNSALKRRHANFGQWLINSQQFNDWKATQDSFLGLHGIPGCGMLNHNTPSAAKVLRGEYREDRSYLHNCRGCLQVQLTNSCLYFIFDFNDSTKQSTDKMIRSLLTQLTFHHGFVPLALESLFSSCQDGGKEPQTEALKNTLETIVKAERFAKLFMVLDALDESGDRQGLLTFIEQVLD
jgi:hypothetical protein